MDSKLSAKLKAIEKRHGVTTPILDRVTAADRKFLVEVLEWYRGLDSRPPVRVVWDFVRESRPSVAALITNRQFVTWIQKNASK